MHKPAPRAKPDETDMHFYRQTVSLLQTAKNALEEAQSYAEMINHPQLKRDAARLIDAF